MPNTEAILSEYFEQGDDARTVAARHGVSQWKVLEIIKTSGRPARNAGHKRVTEPLTPNQLEIITGELLGDGSLNVGRTYVNAKFQWGGKSFEHGAFLHETLGIFAGYFKQDRVYWKIVSKAAMAFTPIWRDWYVSGKKCVPQNLALTPTVVRHWYLGDGYLKRRVHRRPAVLLSTQCFDSYSLETLIRAFHAVQLHPWREKNHSGEMLRFSTDETEAFLRYIGPCPFDHYQYKWL